MPGAAIPGILAPTIFMLGLTSVFGKLTLLPGFTTDDYMTFILPVSLMQGAGFTGAATGVNLARDIELGWFDRPAGVAPAALGAAGGHRAVGSLRALMPITMLLIVGFRLRGPLPRRRRPLLALALVMRVRGHGRVMGSMLALRFKTQAAAPLMQAGIFMAVLFTARTRPSRCSPAGCTTWPSSTRSRTSSTQSARGSSGM